jgi:ATP-binding cassette, subfamily F, member 3
MSLISVTSLSKSFGAVDLFSGITFSIPKGSRLALVGPNGCGKTTLLRILNGLEEPTSGKIIKAKAIRIGYLPQEAEFEMTGTLWDACLDVFSGLISMETELEKLALQMSGLEMREKIITRYGKLQHEFELQGGYTFHMRIKQVLTGLGFSSPDFHMQIEHLSGGQRTRAFLARLLLSTPDLLLLDEPTNHLDIGAVEWLEGYLSQWEGAVAIVSHDRFFLDRVANGILEIAGGITEYYPGNYSDYLKTREERWDRRCEVFETEKSRLLKDIEYIKKNISGQNVSQAKGKLRRLSRIVQAIEQIGMDAYLNQKWVETSEEVSIATSPFGPEEAERRVRSLRSPVRGIPRLHLNLRSTARSGELVLRTLNLCIGYPDHFLFRAPDIVLRRGECAALIGPNGAGKTTFLKTVLGELDPIEGEVTLGASLKVGYFAQAHEGLNQENTVFEEINATMPSYLPGQVRDYLGKYLFSGDDVFKKVSILSGGERGRLALAKLGLQDTNLLLLDEPTNHLDIPSQEVLEAVLEDYGGTILLVTHDRYLIDALGTQIWEINPDESQLAVFKGTYSQRREQQERLALLFDRPDIKTHKTHAIKKNADPNVKEERRRIACLQEVENKIVLLEQQIAELGRKLEHPPQDTALVRKWGNQYTKFQVEMDNFLAEWESLQKLE